MIRGILAGYFGGMIPIFFTLIGIFNFPRPKSRDNQTLRDVSNCTLVFPDFTPENGTLADGENGAEVGEEFWKNFFWVSGLFQGPVFKIAVAGRFGHIFRPNFWVYTV